MDASKLVKAYLNLREARHVLKRKFDEDDGALKIKQERIEAALLGFLNDNKLDRVATPLGTVYRQEEMTPTAADWSAIYDFVKENDAFEMLERRLKKTFVKEYMEQHEGGVPPGVSVFREFVVRVRRS